MEIKYKPVIVLDACSIINLIHAEIEYGSEFVTGRLKKDNFHLRISEKVIDEALKNANAQLLKLKGLDQKRGKYIKNEFSDKENKIEKRIALFRGFITQNESIVRDLGDDYFDNIKKLTGYHKDNGEFYSVALSLYLSRVECCQLTFYTDDFPAQADFSPFFRTQQIGKIEDSADLLIYLYWLYPDFEKEQLIFFLTELRSQYVTDVKLLNEQIRAYKARKSVKRLKDIRKPLNQLELQLQRYELKGVNELRKTILRYERQHKPLCDIIEQFKTVFSLEGNAGPNLIAKIQDTLQCLEDDRIYKIW